MLEIECAAKIGLSGGPLYYRCACRCGGWGCCCALCLAYLFPASASICHLRALVVVEWSRRATVARYACAEPCLPLPPCPSLPLLQLRHVRQPHERAHAPQLVPGLQGHALLLAGALTHDLKLYAIHRMTRQIQIVLRALERVLPCQWLGSAGGNGRLLPARRASCTQALHVSLSPSPCVTPCRLPTACLAPQECHRVLYAQHRAVCSSMLTKPLLPSQVGGLACSMQCCACMHSASGAAECYALGQAGQVPVLVWGLGEMYACMHASPYAHQRTCNQPLHPHALTLPSPPAISLPADRAAHGGGGAHCARRRGRGTAAGRAPPDGRRAAQLPGGGRRRGCGWRGGRVRPVCGPVRETARA